MRKLHDESIITQERLAQMLEEGYWSYNPETARITHMETGETLDTLDWLIKEIEAKNMSGTLNIKISTTTCPKCGHRPIPTVEGKPTICPVCSHVINGGKHGK